MLLTDGYIAREYEVGIDLIDEDCIAFLSSTIGKSYKTYEYTSYGKQKRHRLILSDAKLIADIARLGIVPNKTYDLKGPELYYQKK